jgi:hypothetical protein
MMFFIIFFSKNKFDEKKLTSELEKKKENMEFVALSYFSNVNIEQKVLGEIIQFIFVSLINQFIN